MQLARFLCILTAPKPAYNSTSASLVKTMCKELKTRLLRLVPQTVNGPGRPGDSDGPHDWGEVLKATVYGIKGRNGQKPLAICVGEIEDIYKFCKVTVPEALLRDLLPGPVTLVLERSAALNSDLNPFTP
ncbi:hypothetical protein COCON_G00019130 [Conger conger]|uniref:Threonylcarbamoyl-AMP synthase n=1 Tax=Conger conger TaxID=82655 RepID=A0A9Q1E4K2_CONCO|nr:hypothetical protein COCON_G00019130 [Conger conger]